MSRTEVSLYWKPNETREELIARSEARLQAGHLIPIFGPVLFNYFISRGECAVLERPIPKVEGSIWRRV